MAGHGGRRLRRYLGVDMGGTATKVCLLEEPDEPQRWTAAGGNLALDAENATRGIVALVRDTRPESVCVGVAGARTGINARARLEEEIAPFANHCLVMSDADLALHTAFGGIEDGIVISAGTGTVAAVRLTGQTHIIGGHGFLFGDEGGGFAIGRQLISETLRCRDLNQPGAVDLVGQVESLLGMSVDDFVVHTYRTLGNRAAVAALAAKVETLRHPIAEQVVASAATALINLGLDARIRFGDLPIKFRGGIFGITAISQTVSATLRAQPIPSAPEDIAAHLASHLTAVP